LKVVFLAAHAPVAKGGGLERLMKKMCPPLGFLYLESFTKKYFSEHVEFIISDNLDLLLLQDENIPHIIGISSVTENFNFAIDSARKIRNSIDNKIPIIIGGPHISALPHTLPKEFDIGVIGEGEITFTEILKVYQKNGSFPEKDLHDIAGICFHTEKGYVKINPLRIPVTNLDIIPSPNRRLIPPGSITHIITSRGCRFKCFFCSTPGIWKNYRVHSPSYVARELKDTYEILKNNHIIFFDDLFITDRERIKQISHKLSEEGLLGKLTFFGYGRTEIMDESLVKELKRMNMIEVSLGTQSGLNTFGRDDFSYHQRAIDLCNEYEIKISCSFMIGLPFETEEDLRKVYNFIDKNHDKLYSVQISPLRPFPGTPLWEYAKEKGLVKDNMEDWSRIQSFTLFFDFDIDSYIYLNDSMGFEIFKNFCSEFRSMLLNWKGKYENSNSP